MTFRVACDNEGCEMWARSGSSDEMLCLSQSVLDEEYHFCSYRCLMQWASRQMMVQVR